MNEIMITMARIRSSEMIREADKDRLVAQVRRAARQKARAARAARAAGRPALRVIVSGTRPTATGR